MTRVVNKRFDRYDTFIGRPSKWGNPFVLGLDGSRQEVIDKFEKMARATYSTADLLELRGKVLGCYCKPAPCHGDVLVKMVEELDGDPD